MLYKFMTDGEIVVKIVRGDNGIYIVYHEGWEVASYVLEVNAVNYAHAIMRRISKDEYIMVYMPTGEKHFYEVN